MQAPSLLPTWPVSVALRGLLVVAALVWCVGLPGIWMFDDALFALGNPVFHPESLSIAWLSALIEEGGKTGPLYRLPGMLSFALQGYLGLDTPAAFRAVNICLHLLSAWLVFDLTLKIVLAAQRRHEVTLQRGPSYGAGALAVPLRETLALTVTAIWLLHPIQVSTVLYASQRVTQLSALVSLMTLNAYLGYRMRCSDTMQGGLMSIIILCAGTAAAALCKENGVLVPLYALVAEVTVLGFASKAVAVRRLLVTFFVLRVIVPAILLTAWYVTSGALDPHYARRDFTMTERVLTEWRVLWFYLSLIAWPDFRRMGVFHDDFTVSSGLLTPPSTVLSGLGLLGLAVMAIACRRKQPVMAFGILFWLSSHYLESGFMPLELAFEHRNYLGLAGLALAFSVLLLGCFPSCALLAALIAGLILVLSMSTAMRARDWAEDLRFRMAELAHHPSSPRALAGLATLLDVMPAATEGPTPTAVGFDAVQPLLLRAAKVAPGQLRPWVLMCRSAARHDRAIEPAWVERIALNLRDSPAHQDKHLSMAVLARCAVDECADQALVLRPAFEAALASKRLLPVQRRIVLEYVALYFAKVTAEPARAIAALEESLSLAPDEVRPRVNLAGLLLEEGRAGEARAHLLTARENDSLGHMSKAILSLEARVLQALNGAGTR